MIRVKKSRRTPTVLRDRGRATCAALCTAYDAGGRTFDFDRRVYAHELVKRVLYRNQHDKCCFCESKITPVAYGDVEHFRPKAGYRQRPNDPLTTPGYYWLAYDWANLLFCCQLCNQCYKRNLFPLANPKERAISHRDDLSRERPLLLNPTVDDPEAHIEFREERAFPRNRSPRGRTTIRTLGLNRTELLRRRAQSLADLRAMTAARALLATTIPRSRDHATALEDLDGRLAEHINDAAEYAAMARAFLVRSG